MRKQRNARVILGEVVDVDLEASTVTTLDDVVGFDHLVLATGATHSYFGHDDRAELTPGLKSIDDALEIRRRILLAFERAEVTTDPARLITGRGRRTCPELPTRVRTCEVGSATVGALQTPSTTGHR